MVPTGRRTDLMSLVSTLNLRQKVQRALSLIDEMHEEHGDGLVVAHSLGKDSVAVWDLVKQIYPAARGFIVTTRFKPAATIKFMHETVSRYPELEIYSSSAEIPDRLYETDPELCCYLLKVQPVRKAIEHMKVSCWITGLRCTEGRTRSDFAEIEVSEEGLVKLNPMLIWDEREVWQYIGVRGVKVNPLYAEGYRSLGCAPCTEISSGRNERAGRWVGTSKWGGECGIHTRLHAQRDLNGSSNPHER